MPGVFTRRVGRPRVGWVGDNARWIHVSIPTKTTITKTRPCVKTQATPQIFLEDTYYYPRGKKRLT